MENSLRFLSLISGRANPLTVTLFTVFTAVKGFQSASRHRQSLWLSWLRGPRELPGSHSTGERLWTFHHGLKRRTECTLELMSGRTRNSQFKKWLKVLALKNCSAWECIGNNFRGIHGNYVGLLVLNCGTDADMFDLIDLCPISWPLLSAQLCLLTEPWSIARRL